MRINGTYPTNPYWRVQKVSKIFSENKNRENRPAKQGRWTCAHCGVGIVERLPARCPECDKLLEESIERK
tara:strand:+ start:917 stop:1126 length:210 start_codon:yes stop_codon:yes gene_type:complete